MVSTRVRNVIAPRSGWLKGRSKSGGVSDDNRRIFQRRTVVKKFQRGRQVVAVVAVGPAVRVERLDGVGGFGERLADAEGEGDLGVGEMADHLADAPPASRGFAAGGCGSEGGS